MVRLQTCGKVLRAEHLEVFLHLEDSNFCVQVVYGCHLDATIGDAEGGILDNLQLIDGALSDVWKPDRRCVREERADQGLEGDQNGLLMLPLVCSSE